MAGGKGERLYPLTLERTKPSVPFGGKYRIIDFVLSNFINSGIFSIYVLVQYKSQSLIEHIRSSWKRQGMLSRHFITVVPPQMRTGEREWYRGTADSVFQNMNLILDFKPDLVVVFGGDHIYRMNIQDMINAHIKNKSDVTVACCPFSKSRASSFGVVEMDNNSRIIGFKEKPKNTDSIADDYIYASMGNYIFNPNILVESLNEDFNLATSAHDFGKDIIPKLIKNSNVYAYNFAKNKIPGLKNYEKKDYWQDVGTIESFWSSNMDLLGDKPLLDLDNKDWPIYASSLDCPAAKINNSCIVNSLISEGCVLEGASIKNCILGRGVIIDKGVTVEDTIIMDFTHIKKNSVIKKAIIDRFNIIPEATTVSPDLNTLEDAFVDKDSGITVIKRGQRKFSNLPLSL